MSEADPVVPFYCPFCAEEDLRPSEAATPRGSAAACLACSPSSSSVWRCRLMTATTVRPPDQRRGAPTGAHGAPARTACSRRAGQDLEEALRGGDPAVGRGDLRRSVRHHRVDGRRRCCRTSAASAIPGIDVLFLDTGYHFAETIGTRDAVDATYPVNVATSGPSCSCTSTRRTTGGSTRPTPTCAARCARSSRSSAPCGPTTRGAAAYAATSQRRGRTTPVVAWDAQPRPGEGQPARPVDRRAGRAAYVAENGVLRQPAARDRLRLHRLRALHPPVAPGEDPRAGRWAGRAKTECGLHG